MGAVPRLLAFSLLLGGLREPLWFAVAAVAVWITVWRQRPALGPAIGWLPWLGWAALSALVSSQPLAALPPLARWSTVLACASLAAAWTEIERANWLKAYLLVAAGAAVAAFVTGARNDWAGGTMTGVLPPYFNYTAFVLTGAAAAAAAWAAHPRGPKGRERALAVAVCALCVLCVIVARSRGAWLGLAVAAAVWSARRWGARASASFAIAGALFAGALAGGFLPGPIENALFKKYRMHAEARPRIWWASVAITQSSPWLGVGPGNYAVGFRLHPVPFEDGAARWSMSTEYAHSEPIQAAAETGCAGLALWLIGALMSLRVLIKRAGTDPVREAAAIAAAGLSAHLLVDNMLQIPALAALWLTALAVAAHDATGPRWPRAAALAGAALALVSWIPRSLAATSPARAAVLFPAEPGPREDLAYAAMKANDYQKAMANWAAANSLSPFNAIYPWRAAQLQGASGRWKGAKELAEDAIAFEPGFMRARLLRVEALARLGMTKEARAELDEFRRRRDTRTSVPFHSGYDQTIWEFDAAEYERAVSAASGRK